MRQKRAKAYKRVMALYVSAFKFRQPYQMLVSDDFLVEAGKQKEIDILKMLGTCVQGEIKPMITQCCVEALYRLGKENQFIVNIAKKCERRKCNHRSAIDPADCIKEVVGPTNKHRYVLALSSPSLTRTLSTVPGLPIVHFNARGVLVLSPPSTATIRVKNTAEEGRRIEGAKILDGVVDGENVVGADSTGPRGAAAERTRKVKARGPNPLSMKKKKTAADSEGSGSAQKRRREDNHDVDDDDSAGESEDGGDAAAGRRKKKRRRGRGKGVVAAAIADMRTDDAAGTSEVGGETQE